MKCTTTQNILSISVQEFYCSFLVVKYDKWLAMQPCSLRSPKWHQEWSLSKQQSLVVICQHNAITTSEGTKQRQTSNYVCTSYMRIILSLSSHSLINSRTPYLLLYFPYLWLKILSRGRFQDTSPILDNPFDPFLYGLVSQWAFSFFLSFCTPRPVFLFH